MPSSSQRSPTFLAVAVLLSVAACSSGQGLCESAGGTYEGGACTRSSAGQRAAEQRCQVGGGVYLRGQDVCAVGAGGP